jgi:NAD(P)-dependent dehydrogenase (short-subunit alcohol dehydrogenase family)
VHPNAKTRNSDPDATCVIIGASRGIGLAMSQQIFGRFKGKVAALCRSPDEAGALAALVSAASSTARELVWSCVVRRIFANLVLDGGRPRRAQVQFNPDRMRLVRCDTTDEASVAAAAAQVKEFGGGRVDVLLHTVGILHDRGEGRSGAMPESSLARVDVDFLQRNLLVNTVGPILVLKHFSPMMHTARKGGRVPSVLATLTARVGSITDNALGGWLSYRASKAAHNQALKTASVELGRRGVVCCALHPGTCDTELSVPFQRNVPVGTLFPVDVAACQLLDVVDSLGPEDNGSFLDYARAPILW